MSTQQTNRPRANKKRVKQKKYHDARTRDGLREILANPKTRYWLWSLLDWIEPMGDPRAVTYEMSANGQLVPTGHDPYETAARAAVKKIGVSILNEMATIKPEAMVAYLGERRAAVEENELQEETDERETEDVS